MSRDYDLYIEDLIDCARFVLSETDGVSADDLRRDRRRRDSLYRNLEVMGEAVKQIPQELRLRFPAVNWIGLMRLRDLLAHGYFKANLEIILDNIGRNLATTLAAAEAMLELLGSENTG